MITLRVTRLNRYAAAIGNIMKEQTMDEVLAQKLDADISAAYAALLGIPTSNEVTYRNAVANFVAACLKAAKELAREYGIDMENALQDLMRCNNTVVGLAAAYSLTP